jgi:hypothetical protein
MTKRGGGACAHATGPRDGVQPNGSMRPDGLGEKERLSSTTWERAWTQAWLVAQPLPLSIVQLHYAEPSGVQTRDGAPVGDKRRNG